MKTGAFAKEGGIKTSDVNFSDKFKRALPAIFNIQIRDYEKLRFCHFSKYFGRWLLV